METLVVSQHRTPYHGRGGSHISNGYYSSPPRGLKGVNCRAFQSGIGLFPQPAAIPPARTCPSPRSEPPKRSRSSPIPIASKPFAIDDTAFSDDLRCPELWAGPAYSNSPPPSSLPIPKFSLCRKQTVSLSFKDHPFAKSAPASPTREAMSPSLVFATRDLRRILNLDASCE